MARHTVSGYFTLLLDLDLDVFLKNCLFHQQSASLGNCCVASIMISIYGNNFVRILLEYFSATSVAKATCVATAYCTSYGPDEEHVNYFHLFIFFQTQEP